MTTISWRKKMKCMALELILLTWFSRFNSMITFKIFAKIDFIFKIHKFIQTYGSLSYNTFLRYTFQMFLLLLLSRISEGKGKEGRQRKTKLGKQLGGLQKNEITSDRIWYVMQCINNEPNDYFQILNTTLWCRLV